MSSLVERLERYADLEVDEASHFLRDAAAALAALAAECRAWRKMIDREHTGTDHHGDYITLREIYRCGRDNGMDEVTTLLDAIAATDASAAGAVVREGE